MEQGSYLLIQPGMTVRGTDADLGTVSQVVADTRLDVFRGIVLSHGFVLAKQSFISEDHVVSVHDNVVEVNLSKAEAGALPSVTTEASQGKETT